MPIPDLLLLSWLVCCAIAIVAPDRGLADDTKGIKQVAGWIEPVAIAGFSMEAKLDTGAQTSALHATGITKFRRDGELWLRFWVTTPPLSEHGETPGQSKPVTARVEGQMVRKAVIKRAGGQPDRRPVILLPVCLAGHSFMTEFTLTDRTGLQYSALIGRSALKGRLFVDAARTQLTKAICSAARPTGEDAD